MNRRVVLGSLWRRRNIAAVAVLAVAIGTAVASALINVARDVEHKVAVELRALGPNLLLVPDTPGANGYLDEAMVRARLLAAELPGTPLLLGVARVRGQAVPVVGADLPAAIRLHPTWGVAPGSRALIGRRLMERLGLEPGGGLALEDPSGARKLELSGLAVIDAGASDDAVWIPLAQAQSLCGLPGRVSMGLARIEGRDAETASLVSRLERGSGIRALPLRALSAAEGRLLDRTRRMMWLVVAAALLGAGLCAFGALTDLALERRREVALLKALGAGRRDVVGLFSAESVLLGLSGGVVGWLSGLGLAQLIGHQVFGTALTVRWDIAPLVLALAVVVALAAGLGPLRLMLAVDPAPALKGE